MGDDINRIIYNFDYVTTFYDLYGFENVDGLGRQQIEEKILELVEVKLRHKVLPYVQQCEFEGLLFSQPSALKVINSSLEDWANTILSKFNNNPEEINDCYDTCPSRRLKRQYPDYKKTIEGNIVAKEIGIPKMKEMCSNFRNWVEQLEKL